MISRHRYKEITNNCIQKLRLLADSEEDFKDCLEELEITPQELEEIEHLDTSAFAGMFGGLNNVDVDGNMITQEEEFMNPPI